MKPWQRSLPSRTRTLRRLLAAYSPRISSARLLLALNNRKAMSPALQVVSTLRKANSEETLLSEIAHVLEDVVKADSCEILLRDSGDGLIQRASTHSPEFNR